MSKQEKIFNAIDVAFLILLVGVPVLLALLYLALGFELRIR